MALTQLCLVDEVQDSEPFQAVIEGFDAFAVFNVDGEIFVIQDKCNHAGASLSLEGYQEGHFVTCGWHDAKFDLRDGSVHGGPCPVGQKAYPVTIEDGKVLVDL